MLCEQLQSKLLELRTEAEKVTDDPHDLSLAEEAIAEQQQKECIHNLRQLHKHLLATKVRFWLGLYGVLSTLYAF